MRIPRVPETQPQSYVIDVVCDRTAGPVYTVTDGTIEELQDIVIFYHQELEKMKRLLDTSITEANKALGYDNL